MYLRNLDASEHAVIAVIAFRVRLSLSTQDEELPETPCCFCIDLLSVVEWNHIFDNCLP